MLEMTALHLQFYISAFMVCLIILLYTSIQGRFDRLQSKLFVAMVSVLLVNSITSIACKISEPYAVETDAAFTAMKVFTFLYFPPHTVLTPMFAYSVLSVTGMMNKFSRKDHMLFLTPVVLVELMALLNPFTDWVYSFSADKKFIRNTGEIFLYLCAAFYFIFAVAVLLLSWKAITRKRRKSLLFFVVLVVSGVMAQLLFMELEAEVFCEALALMGVMITVENEEERIDSDIDVYNRKALNMDLKNHIANKQRFYVICVKITNPEIIQRVTGSANSDILIEMVTNYLKGVIPRYYIYHTSPDTIVLTLMNPEAAKAQELAEKISGRFSQEWICKDTSVMLNSVVMVANIPDDLKRHKDVFYMADSPVPSNNTKRILAGADLDYLVRRVAVKSAIQRGLTYKNFEVYYQPTYSLKELRIYGAEALIRLHDTEIGNVFPDEFIPIAEQIGLIDDIDDFVLEEVCAFIKSGIPSEKGITGINVNLSVIQCMRPDFVKHILDIVEKSGIDKSMVNFEITESVAASDYDVLSSVVSELKANGFQIAMDDYGTGYSNMQSLFTLDFDVVKIDKSILWEAEKSELGRIILENSVRMIKQMERKILVEGVETMEQIALLRTHSVDYLQGYYFSRPVPKKDFIEVISRNKNA